MKVKGDFVLSPMADSFVVVPVGDANMNLNVVISLNETGAFLWKNLQNETTAENLLCALTAEYDVDQATAKEHIEKFLKKLKEKNLLEE